MTSCIQIRVSSSFCGIQLGFRKKSEKSEIHVQDVNGTCEIRLCVVSGKTETRSNSNSSGRSGKMVEQLIDESILIPITAILCVFIWGMVVTTGGFIAQMFSVWRHTRLKERMLDRGLSVHEIERLMNAGVSRTGKSNKKCRKPPTYEDSYLAKTN